MEHKTAKTIQITPRHGFHLQIDRMQNDPASLQDFLAFAEQSATRHVVVEFSDVNSLTLLALHSFMENGIQATYFFKTNYKNELTAIEVDNLVSSLESLQCQRLIICDRPNHRDAWDLDTWLKPELIDIFLDRFTQVAEKCLAKGIQPVFPPLQPGGDYWDTAFLRQALQTLKDNSKDTLLDKLAISAYGWTYNHPLDWGVGGPERYPNSTPYNTPKDSQDQMGFHIFDWYQTIIQAVLNRRLPILLLQAGSEHDPVLIKANGQQRDNISKVQDIMELLYPSIYPTLDEGIVREPIPAEVVLCSFPSVDDLQGMQGLFNAIVDASPVLTEQPEEKKQTKNQPASKAQHYLLLPDESWHTDPAKQNALAPFLEQFHPDLGTSLDEALDATEVTLLLTDEDSTQEKMGVLEEQDAIFLRKMRLEIKPILEVVNDHHE